MSNVLHRTTLEYHESVNTPDFPDPPWLRNPDMSAVVGVPARYWKLTGDVVSEMNQTEKDAVDAAEAAQVLSQKRTTARGTATDSESDGFQLRALIELFNKRDNYLTNRIIELQNALDAVKASSGTAQNIRDAIPASWLATDTRPRPAAVSDYDDIINNGEADT